MTMKLSTKQNKAIESLLNGFNKQQAAAAAGVIPGTLSRWLADDDFQAVLSEGADNAIKTAAARFGGSLETAADVMLEIMKNSEDDSLRLRAADMVINHSHNLTKLLDYVDRIEALERAVNVHR